MENNIAGGYLVPELIRVEKVPGIIGWFFRLIKSNRGWVIFYPYKELLSGTGEIKWHTVK